MKNSKQTHNIVRQNDTSVKQSHKHDANLQKNSTLYFQVGLIVCLIAALGLFEMRFENKMPKYVDNSIVIDDTFEATVEPFKIYEKPKVEVKPKPITKKVVLVETPTIVEDNAVIKQALNIDTSEQITSDELFDADALNIAVPEDVVVAFVNIEEAPIYPGCEKEKDSKGRKKCMSDKINKLVRHKFNGALATDYGLSGVQKIYVEFLVDKTGEVKNIKTRAPHPKLQEEAERLVNKIPAMQPGKQRDKPVGVKYTLPIIFKAN